MKLAVFYDYTCPYCLRGHKDLTGLLPENPSIEVQWRPCEAHPRPERYGRHSDLCARGMYIAQEHGADLTEVHWRLYKAAQEDRLDIEDPQVIADALSDLLAPEILLKALARGDYIQELAENNRLAWQEYGFVAVPSMELDGKLLPSVENVGLTRAGIAQFLKEADA